MTVRQEMPQFLHRFLIYHHLLLFFLFFFCIPLRSSKSLCSTLQIQTEMDSAYLLETLAGNFMDVVQYNEDNRGFEVRERYRKCIHMTSVHSLLAPEISVYFLTMFQHYEPQ